MKNKYIIILILVMIFSILGISYAWFNYRKESGNQQVITGNIYLNLEEGNDSINLNNVYPESKEEARSKNDNYVIFSLSGINTSDSDVHYEIFLNYGDSINGMMRYNDKDLVFDLIEIGNNNEETYLLDAVSFDTLNNRKIWIDRVLHNTNSEIERTYKLRMWLSNRVLISDTDPNASYAATGSNAFKNYYGSIKVGVEGDLKEKSLPSSTITRDSYVENGKSYFLTNLTNDYLLEDEGELLDENDTVVLEITNPENKLYFNYVDSKGNEDYDNNASLVLSYVYNRNETVNIKVFTVSRTDSNVNTTLHFKVTKNGNIVQEYNKEINVIGNNYCLNNGFTKLSDCILVTENLSNNVNSAISYINSKGSPDITKTAPIMNYTYYLVNDTPQTNILNIAPIYKWSFSQSYTFDETLAKFIMQNPISDDLSTDYIGYYTCGRLDNGTRCDTIYKITNVHIDTNYIDGYAYSYREVSSFNSEIGLYKVEVGNNTGNYSYVYRGEVENNNVKFGNMYWKILRINENGSVRLIYNGTTLSSNGNIGAGDVASIGTAAYNKAIGPTALGYMYNTSSTPIETNYVITENFDDGISYYWGEGYTSTTDSEGLTTFKLSSGNNNYPLVAMTTSEMINDATGQLSKTPYTCKLASSTGTCTYLIKVESLTNVTSGQVKYISKNYNTKAEADLPVIDSLLKKKIDDWYINNFSNQLNNNKNVTLYLSDEIFCSNRNISRTSNASGYLLNENTYLDVYYLDPATLACRKEDSYTVSETTSSNGFLTYPVGTITYDELCYSGALWNYKNERFYLHTGSSYRTMSPQSYRVGLSNIVLFISERGVVGSGEGKYARGVRPVINLKADTKIMQGDGTPSNPYIIE